MRSKDAEQAGAAYEGTRRLFILLFFLAGALLSRTSMAGDLPEKLSFLPTAYLYALCFGAVLVLSASMWGTVLLPGCTLIFGCVTGGYAEWIVKTLYSGAGVDLKGLLVNAAAVPLFFLAAVRGMRISAMLGDMLDRNSASARADYNREYIPMTLIALAGIVTVYLLLG